VKINININEEYKEMEVTVNCSRIDTALEKVIASLRVLDSRLTGIKDSQTFILEAAKVLYIDTVDKKTFLYTSEDIYETPLKLYELEDLLSGSDFFRAGKSSIINFSRIKSLQSDIDGKLIVTMENKEKLIVSRQYAVILKEKLRRYEQ